MLMFDMFSEPCVLNRELEFLCILCLKKKKKEEKRKDEKRKAAFHGVAVFTPASSRCCITDAVSFAAAVRQ